MGRGDSGGRIEGRVEGIQGGGSRGELRGFQRRVQKSRGREGQRFSGIGFGKLVGWMRLHSPSSSLNCVCPPCLTCHASPAPSQPLSLAVQQAGLVRYRAE